MAIGPSSPSGRRTQRGPGGGESRGRSGESIRGFVRRSRRARQWSPVLTGELATWDDVVRAGHAAAAAWVTLRNDNPGDVVVDISPEQSEPASVGAARVSLHTQQIPDSADVVVIGAGICGMATAFALARAGLGVAVLHSASRIGEMTTSWNNGMVHPCHDPKPGTLMALLNIRGNAEWSELMQALGLFFERRASLVVGFGDADDARLEGLLSKAQVNGVPGAELISAIEHVRWSLGSVLPSAAPYTVPTTASIDPVMVAESLAAELRGRRLAPDSSHASDAPISAAIGVPRRPARRRQDGTDRPGR